MQSPNESFRAKSFILTVAAGKRLIAKGMAARSDLRQALENGTVVIVAGTTNAYVAEEILASLGQGESFSRSRFYRGITLPPGKKFAPSAGEDFPGDVVLVKGEWHKGKSIFDVVDGLAEGDVIIKGANALDVAARKAGILIGHPKGGTIGVALLAVAGRRVRLILPTGLEKRVAAKLEDLADIMNAPGAHGPRLLPAPGEAFCELDAVELLTGAKAHLVAAGGIEGAEGSVWIAVRGTPAQLEAADALIRLVATEEPFAL